MEKKKQKTSDSVCKEFRNIKRIIYIINVRFFSLILHAIFNCSPKEFRIFIILIEFLIMSTLWPQYTILATIH